MTRLKMKNYNTLLTEKQQKYQHYYQVKLIEQAKFTYSPLGKSFEKQIKAIEDQGIKQAEALKTLSRRHKIN